MNHTHLIVIGAGVLGLAIARKIALSGRNVVVVERERTFGRGISSRNSGVLHAGIYYRPNSLKARLCVAGARKLSSYCEERGIPICRYGKLIVATERGDEIQLERLYRRGLANDVNGLSLIEKKDVLRLEPCLRAAAALSSLQTAVFDVQAYLSSLARDAEDAGAILAFSQTVDRIVASNSCVTFYPNGEDAAMSADWIINAAGLDAASLVEPKNSAPKVRFVKGSYFELADKAPFSRLVYPLPNKDGLGIHMTLDLTGRARFGPDTEPLAEPDFKVDIARRGHFARNIRKYWPDLRISQLRPAYAGVRPVLSEGNDADFLFHRSGRTINLLGFGSPGLTASLAIADHVAAMIEAS